MPVRPPVSDVGTPLPGPPDDPNIDWPSGGAPYTVKSAAQHLYDMILMSVVGGARIYRWAPGSVARRMLEAVAIELERLQYEFARTIRKAVREACYLAFGFSRNPATGASGQVTFSRTDPAPQNYTVPQGTLVGTRDGRQYVTTAAVTLTAGSLSVNAPVQALTPGALGNARAGDVNAILTSVEGVLKVTNALAITGGADAESDEALLARFQVFVRGLQGATYDGVAAAVAGVTAGSEVVRDFLVAEPWKIPGSNAPGGLIYVYVDNGSGSASSALLTAVRDAARAKAAAGCLLVALAVGSRAVNVTATVRTVSGTPSSQFAAIQSLVQSAFAGYLASLPIEDGYGRATVDRTRLIAAGLTAHPAIIGIDLGVPGGNVVPALGERPVLGSVSITVV